MSYQPGKYRFKINNQGFAESKEKKTPFFFIEGQPIAMLHDDGSEENVEGFNRRIDFYLTDKSVDRTIEDLTGLGWPGGSWKTLDLDVPNGHSFLGQEIVTVCEPNPNDPKYDRFRLPGNGGSSEKMVSDPSLAKKMDAMYGSKLPKPTKAPANRAALATVSTPSGDDIPF